MDDKSKGIHRRISSLKRLAGELEEASTDEQVLAILKQMDRCQGYIRFQIALSGFEMTDETKK